MKLLHVHDFFAPGNSRFAFDMDRLLAARGHSVHVLSAVGERGPADGAVLEGVTFHTYAHRPELPTLKRLAYSVSSNEKMFESLHAEHGFDVLVLNQPLCAEGVLKVPAASPLPKVYWFISPWAAEWRASNPAAGAVARLFQESMRHRLEDRAVRACDAVLVESEYIRKLLREHHRKVDPKKVHLIPGAVDLARFNPGENGRSVFSDSAVVLTVRRLVERMGIDLLIDAATEVPGVQLVIGGEGPLRESLEARARSLNVQARFLGYVADEDLPEVYRSADLFVLPTRALEGFGLVAIEAMACGTPAMGTPVGAIPEVLGPLGLVFEEATPKAIAAGIRRFFAERDPGLPRRCRDHVAARYDWNKVIEQVERVLLEVIRESAGHRRG